jgi:hypothetical protein
VVPAPSASPAPPQAAAPVTVVPPKPAAKDDHAALAADGSATVDVTANDTAGSGRLAIVAHGNAAHGTVTCTTTRCSYQAAAGYTGPDSFTYTVSDSSGAVSSAVVRVAAVTTPAPLPAGPVPPAPAPAPAATGAARVFARTVALPRTGVDVGDRLLLAFLLMAAGIGFCRAGAPRRT